MRRRISITILAVAVIAAIASAIALTRSAPPEPAPRMAATLKVMPAVAISVSSYLVASTLAQAAVLPGIVRTIDAQLGYPQGVCGPPQKRPTPCPVGGTYPDGGHAPTAVDAQHYTAVIPHPTNPSVWAVPLDGYAAPVVQTVAAACASALDAGNAVSACSTVTALPSAVATLDPTWTLEAGATPYWYTEAGASPTVPTCPDVLDGGSLVSVSVLDASAGGLEAGAIDSGIHIEAGGSMSLGDH
jgi:hypothetical protein